jgi:hypothetical protein
VEDPPVRLGEMAAREPGETTLLAEHVQRPSRTELAPNARLHEAEEVPVEHDDHGRRSVGAAPDELERARALAVNDVERLRRTDPHEGLV